MLYLTRTPSPPLAPFVASLWYCAGAPGPHARERIMPTGTMGLIINLAADELRSYHGDGYAQLRRVRGAALCGPHAQHFAIDTAEQREVLGVNFKPGGAYPFFAPPASAVRELHVDLDDVWARDGAVLRERVLAAPTPEAKLATVEALLLARAARPLVRDPEVAFAVAAFERDLPVADVTERLGLTPRRFIARFCEQVGLTPKRYACVRRFQRVLDVVARGGAVDWAGVAVDTGYFDQAHLIHDFRAFSGVSPTAYRPLSASARNHMPLPDGNGP